MKIKRDNKIQNKYKIKKKRKLKSQELNKIKLLKINNYNNKGI